MYRHVPKKGSFAMHILLTNDDGFRAKGLRELAAELAKHHRVTIVAPDREQSAKSHAITIQDPVRTCKVTRDPEANPQCIAVSGTPTDCMKLALYHLLKDDMPDLVVSGVNDGFNLGSDALYSGTVSAAMEAMFYKVPALAVSMERYSSERSAEIMPFIAEFVDRVYGEEQYKGLLNMNFSKEGPIGWDQVEILDQGMQHYSDIIDEREDRKGRKYYWIGGRVVFIPEETRTDVMAIKDQKITVVALTWKQQDEAGTQQMRDFLGK